MSVSLFFGLLMVLAMIATPVLVLVVIIYALSKKQCKTLGLIASICAGSIIPFAVLGVVTSPETWCDHEYAIVEEVAASCTEQGKVVKVCPLCEGESTEYIDKLGHDMVDVRKVEPTHDADGEYVRGCTRCGYEEVTVLEKLPKPTETEPTETNPPTETTEPPETTTTPVAPEIAFDEIYKAYKSNELVADDLYGGNRYRITATIRGIEAGGLLNLTGGAVLTMEVRVDNTIVFFLAEFEKDQEEALKKVAVGDTITFEGTCLSAGNWDDCEIME